MGQHHTNACKIAYVTGLQHIHILPTSDLSASATFYIWSMFDIPWRIISPVRAEYDVAGYKFIRWGTERNYYYEQWKDGVLVSNRLTNLTILEEVRSISRPLLKFSV